jgi:hypothetical protein
MREVPAGRQLVGPLLRDGGQLRGPLQRRRADNGAHLVVRRQYVVGRGPRINRTAEIYQMWNGESKRESVDR